MGRTSERLRALADKSPGERLEVRTMADLKQSVKTQLWSWGGTEPRLLGGRESPVHSVFGASSRAGGSYRGSYRTRRVPGLRRSESHGRQWTSVDDCGRAFDFGALQALSVDVHRRPASRRGLTFGGDGAGLMLRSRMRVGRARPWGSLAYSPTPASARWAAGAR